MTDGSVITVGFCPAWDITCRAEGVDWGRHVKAAQTAIPAGKALNVSKALAWLGQKSIAAGLWGQNDWPDAQAVLASLNLWVDFRMTLVAGRTRQNITVIDTRNQREMHLRAPYRLATSAALTRLSDELKPVIGAGCTVVFSGSMPGDELVDGCLLMIRNACRSGARVVIDSSGEALQCAVLAGGLYAIKPNLEELGQLLGRPIANEPTEIIAAARTLCDKAQIALVSRGADGAIVVTQDKAVGCRAKPAKYKVVNTVACGDYLLAGFLADETAALSVRLENAITVATARAWGLTETIDWSMAKEKIEIETTVF